MNLETLVQVSAMCLCLYIPLAIYDFCLDVRTKSEIYLLSSIYITWWMFVHLYVE
ncbi:hypothetical protein O3M35_002629 [Rhynocoris fuscipes]|uniref:Uncharacterized protein n=1 Tax=Rhynocoris fuscipes TaxID=488301 RepID=A0AAW1CMG3_9HEMI